MVLRGDELHAAGWLMTYAVGLGTNSTYCMQDIIFRRGQTLPWPGGGDVILWYLTLLSPTPDDNDDDDDDDDPAYDADVIIHHLLLFG